MAEITATYKSDLATLIGVSTEIYDAKTVKDLLNQMKARHGKEAYKLAKTLLITVNSLSIQLDHKHYATRLDEGDVVGFFPLAAGG